MDDLVAHELNYFNDNFAQIYKKYTREWVAIKGHKVIAHSIDREAVLKEVLEEHELGTFLFRRVLPQEEYTQRFFSRVF